MTEVSINIERNGIVTIGVIGEPYLWYKKRVVRYKPVPPDPPDHCNTIKESTSLSDSSNLKT